MSDIKLKLDLIPKTSWYKNVRSEISKKDWKVIRESLLETNDTCNICKIKSSKLELHEIFEYCEDSKIQKLVGLALLCFRCHRVCHYGLWQMKGKENELNEHLMKVNGWDLEETKKYVANCFKEWYDRSQYEWKLDLQYLKDEFDISIKSEE